MSAAAAALDRGARHVPISNEFPLIPQMGHAGQAGSGLRVESRVDFLILEAAEAIDRWRAIEGVGGDGSGSAGTSRTGRTPVGGLAKGRRACRTAREGKPITLKSFAAVRYACVTPLNDDLVEEEDGVDSGK